MRALLKDERPWQGPWASPFPFISPVDAVGAGVVSAVPTFVSQVPSLAPGT